MTDLENRGSPVIVALDFNNDKALLDLVDKLDPKLCKLKIGKEVFTRSGPSLVEQLMQQGFDVFLDLKFHDIPTTVAKAVRSAAELGVWMVNVHALGGQRMLEAAKESLSDFSNPPLLIAVTVLTSHSDNELQQLGLPACDVLTAQLAELAARSGLDGVVCSARDASMLKQRCGQGFLAVTPGIRPSGSEADDQTRILTPAEAIRQGSDYLVIGRPVTQSKEPTKTLETILASL